MKLAITFFESGNIFRTPWYVPVPAASEGGLFVVILKNQS